MSDEKRDGHIKDKEIDDLVTSDSRIGAPPDYDFSRLNEVVAETAAMTNAVMGTGKKGTPNDKRSDSTYENLCISIDEAIANAKNTGAPPDYSACWGYIDKEVKQTIANNARLQNAVKAIGGPAATMRYLKSKGAPIAETTLHDWLSGRHQSASVAILALALELYMYLMGTRKG